MPDIITMGELLVDFVPEKSNSKLKDVKKFSRVAGGAPANVAVALAKLSYSAGFIGMVGQDAFGDFLFETLKTYNVEVSQLKRTTEAMTTLAFVSLFDQGERDFAFYRKPGADMLLKLEDIDLNYLNEAKIFHFGSISLTNNPVKETTHGLIKKSLDNDIIISFDLNIRLPLWNNDINRLKDEFYKVLPYLDILKLNLEELNQIIEYNIELNKFEKDKIKLYCNELINMGPDYIIITLGSEGAYFVNENQIIHDSLEPIEAIDTTGAGDAFMAGILSSIIDNIKPNKSLSNILKELDWYQVLKRANEFGLITSSRYGAIPSLPNPEDLE